MPVTIDTNAWTTLAYVREHLHIGISETYFDDQLSNLINRSLAILEAYIGHGIKSRTITEYYDGDGTNKLVLNKWPLISVTSIHVDSERVFGSDYLMDTDDYYVDTEHGIVEVFQETGSGPVSFECGVKNVKVVYVAGYATIPADLVHIANEHVALLFRRSATEGTTSQSLGGKSEIYDESSMPRWLMHRLAPYKDRSC